MCLFHSTTAVDGRSSYLDMHSVHHRVLNEKQRTKLNSMRTCSTFTVCPLQ